MPSNIKPRVNEAREFLEIAKDFKDAREIIREALSNSWDAGADSVSIRFDLAPLLGTRRKKIMVEIADNGRGMSSELRPEIGSSEIEGFFNLGDSYKPQGSIGSKGHGTKIYYKSSGIQVRTCKNGRRIEAKTEQSPWEALSKGVVPTYRYDEVEAACDAGTRISVDGFQAKQSEFESIDPLVRYITWYTIAGSFGHYFGHSRTMDVDLKPLNSSQIRIPFGFSFPREDRDLSKGSASFCALLGPEKINCGATEGGKPVVVEIIGAIVGENHRSIVPDTYSDMGLWLCKDYIRVERKNSIIEAAFKGQYYYRSFLILANCQSFDLTANRNDIRADQEEYDLALSGILDYCKKVWSSDDVRAYFSANRDEQTELEAQKREKEAQARKERADETRKQRINRYKGRSSLNAPGVAGAPLKEPESEAETALLLQAMISTGHPGIDFRIGDYNTTYGVDLVVELSDKGIPSLKWAELVSSLDKLFAWAHPPEGFHLVVCYQLGKVAEVQKFTDGSEARLVKAGTAGRYVLVVGSSNMSVYVLKELLTG